MLHLILPVPLWFTSCLLHLHTSPLHPFNPYLQLTSPPGHPGFRGPGLRLAPPHPHGSHRDQDRGRGAQAGATCIGWDSDVLLQLSSCSAQAVVRSSPTTSQCAVAPAAPAPI